MKTYICSITWLYHKGIKIVSVFAMNKTHAKIKLHTIYISLKGFKILNIELLI